MKIQTKFLVAAALFLLTTPAFSAHDFNVKDKINMMKTDLNLTDDQVKAVKPILQDYKTQLEQLNKQKEDRLGAVLSPEQISKMKEIKENREKMEK